MPQRWFILILFIFALSGCSAELITGCDPKDRLVPICGVQNPEDMVVLPSQDEILISQFGGTGGSLGGGFAVYHIGENSIRQLAFSLPSGEDLWGAGDCVVPPVDDFSPHGIDLVQRTDGRWQMLAINHGKSGRVERF